MVQARSSVNSSLTITGFQNNQDLREISWNIVNLERIVKEWEIDNNEAVIFCNVAQDRYRLVAVLNDMPTLILPPIDSADQTSLYLKISLFLRRFKFANNEADKFLAEEIDFAETRMKRRKELAEAALLKRGSR